MELFSSSFFHRQGYVNTFANIAYVYNFCKWPVCLPNFHFDVWNGLWVLIRPAPEVS